MNETIFRIYCEDVNRDGIDMVLSRNLEGFTVTPGMGFYKGQKEKSLVIEAFGTTRSAVKRVCQELADESRQEQVIFTESPCFIGTVFGTREAR